MILQLSRLHIPEVILITPKVFEDRRGIFIETYKYSIYREAGIKEYFVQDNYSRSRKNVLRGLHYQNHPKAQGKLVRCIKGRVFDVCVDIRKSSPTFGKWVSHELDDSSHQSLYVPAGFAHGFLALTESAEVMYKCTEEYAPECERGIIWNDPDLGIAWPVTDPLLSGKDKNHPSLKNAEIFFQP
jgi:dTDP-4-dehydrorhamnose 3,5-epimerase